MALETIISVCLGIGLSAAVGFRVFVPLFILSLATYSGFWELNNSWQWIGSLSAVLLFGVATIVEIAAYYIPFIDNALDALAIPLATIAGTAVMVSTTVNLSPVITWALAIIAGGGTAALVSSSSAATRLTSTTTTAGLANPVVSTVETMTSIIMAIISIFIPVLGLVLAIVLFFILFKIYKKFKLRKA